MGSVVKEVWKMLGFAGVFAWWVVVCFKLQDFSEPLLGLYVYKLSRRLYHSPPHFPDLLQNPFLYTASHWTPIMGSAILGY